MSVVRRAAIRLDALKGELALTETPAELDAGGRLVLTTLLPDEDTTALLRYMADRSDALCEYATELEAVARDELPAVTAVDGFLLGIATERELRGDTHLHTRSAEQPQTPPARVLHGFGYVLGVGFVVGVVGLIAGLLLLALKAVVEALL